MGATRHCHMQQTLKVAPLRATVLLIAGVLLLFYATCVSAEVSQHLVVEEASLAASGGKGFSASAQKTLTAQEAALSRTNAGGGLSTATFALPTRKPTKAPTQPPPTLPPTPIDWSHCKSEGGTKNCAKCNQGDNGVLPCDQAALNSEWQYTWQSTCGDNNLWKGRFFEFSDEKGKGRCDELENVCEGAVTQTTYNFPGGIGNSSADKLDRNLVATKVVVAHPDGANKNVGVVMFKRMVMHQCTGTKPDFCKKGDKVADVFKQGFCVRCKMEHYTAKKSSCAWCPLETRAACGNSKCTVFSSPIALKANRYQKKQFVYQCFRKAFTPEGIMKDEYRCTKEDMLYAGASIAMF